MKKMIIRIVLFLSCGILVSANSGYPVMPIQTYPIYQQNGYTNPPANQPGDITSYLQNMMVQNQSPSLNLSPINIRQMLLDRILSNQPIQSIFDQSSAGYGSNLVEYPYNAAALNPVNNFVNIQQTGANEEDTTSVVQREEKRKKAKKRMSSKRRKHDKSQKNNHSSSKNEADDIQENDREISKKSKKRTRKHKAEDSSNDSHSKHSEKESNKKTKKKKRKHKDSEVRKSIDEETVDETLKPRRRHKKKPKPDTEKIITEEQTTPKPHQILEGLNLDVFKEGIVEENRVPRNPIPAVNQLLKTIPNLPENIANSFNFKALPQFSNPAMASFLGNYENMYQSLISNNKDINNHIEVRRKRPQKSKNNNKRKIEVKNKNATTSNDAIILSTTKQTITPKINIVTTEKTIYINDKTRTNIDPDPKTESIQSIDKPSEVNETTFENVDFNVEHDEIENNEPNINDNYSYGYVEDYYPQFADSAAYTANKREVFVKNLGDTKYYYSVDKGNPDFINRMRFESFGPPKNVTKVDKLNKTYDSAEKAHVKDIINTDAEEEVVQFRSPPQLESPDFETRQVELSNINPERYYSFDDNDDFDQQFQGDKASIYSEVKIPHYTGTKDNSKKTFKEKPKDVETVFAKSKVVSYGPVYIPEEESSAETKRQALTDDDDSKDKGVTYVLATSLDPEFS